MVRETTLRERRRLELPPATSPNGSVAGNMADLLHDLCALVELQAKLAVMDASETGRKLRIPGACAAVGLALLLGCFPVLLLTCAHAMIAAGMYAAVAYLLATVLGLLVSGGLFWFAWTRSRENLTTFERSREELDKNISWFKCALLNKGCRPR